MLHVDTRIARLALAIAVTIGAICSVTGGALANSLLINPAGTISASSLRAQGDLALGVNGLLINCPTTLTLSVNARATKTRGTQIGTVTAARSSSCTDQTEVRYLNLPWTLRYETITGALPSEIAEVLLRISNVQLLVRRAVCGGFLGCLYAGDVTVFLPLYHLLIEEPYVNQLLLINQPAIPLERDLSGNGDCSSTMSMLGQFSLEPLQLIVDE